MSESPPVSAEPRANAVGNHVNCLRCDYNLHGLPIDGVCPECA